jgi:hypothetical protein
MDFIKPKGRTSFTQNLSGQAKVLELSNISPNFEKLPHSTPHPRCLKGKE